MEEEFVNVLEIRPFPPQIAIITGNQLERFGEIASFFEDFFPRHPVTQSPAFVECLSLTKAQMHRAEMNLVAIIELDAIFRHLALVDPGAAGALLVEDAVMVAF
jgi:hypothetical protein